MAAGGDADVRGEDLVLDDLLRPRLRLRTPWGEAEVVLAVHGAHQAANAVAAATCALALGVDLDDVVEALGAAHVSGLRMEMQRAPSGAVVINDAYNANPTSMRAALEALAALPGDGRAGRGAGADGRAGGGRGPPPPRAGVRARAEASG